MKSYRNGDWGFYPMNEGDYKKSVAGKEFEKHDAAFTFAEGEATGHFHTIKVANPDDLEIVRIESGEYVMRLKSEATITHPEHSLKTDLFVKPGIYRLSQRREKNWLSLSVRRVID